MKAFNVPDSQIVSGISFHTVGAACRKARRLKLVLRGGVCNSCWLAERMLRDGVYLNEDRHILSAAKMLPF